MPELMKRHEGMGPLQAFLNDAALFSPDDMAAERDSNAVRLSTIHASKGLEFPVVFSVGRMSIKPISSMHVVLQI